MDVLRECGFNFTSTARDIARRFPKEFDWGVASLPVLPFRLTCPFAGFGEVWKIPVSRDVDFDLPPTSYSHEFHPTGDVRENFDRAVNQLTEVFGPGHSGRATNVYEQDWQIGFFRLQVISWPRELNATSQNVYSGKNPYLGISANIYIRPAFPFIQPSEDASEPIEELLVPSETHILTCDSPVYARRNRISAPAGVLVAGLAHQSFIIRSPDRTLRVPLKDIQKIVLTRLTPARFSGSSSILFETLFLNRHPVSVSIATGTQADSLDEIAARLSQALAKPLVVKEYPDID